MGDSNGDYTKYGTYPMDFTCVDRDNNNQYTRPGIFTPTNPGWNINQNPYIPPYSQTTPMFVSQDQGQTTPPSKIPSVSSQYSYPVMTSTPVTEQFNHLSGNSGNLAGENDSNGWKGFFLKWILGIVFISVLISGAVNMYPWHELVCWLKLNFVVICTTVFILFLLTVIVKMFEGDKRRKNTLYEPCTVQPMDGSNFTPPERTYQEKDQKVRKKLSFEPEERFGSENSARQSEIHVKRTFDGTTQDVWSDFLRYYENIATLNGWSDERKRMVFLTTLRGQAEAYVHGLPNSDIINWNSLLQKMELRFGHSNMKESYLVEAKLRKRKSGETFRDLGQSIEDLYRRAYPASPDTVQENSIKTFLDACGESEEFRLSVRRSRPKTLQDAVTSAMEEECIRLSERHKNSMKKSVYSVETNNKDQYSRRKNDNSQRGRRVPNTANYRKAKVEDITCYNCGEIGHYRSQCGRLLRGNIVPPVKTDGDRAVSQLNGARSEQ
ncbi:unnamed protein product [Mytilus edulis]|uniref:CCHC-type domain-containing protein n=1 Tax=Mytilus edulis TaxID=6550 RepID=A0A8S3SCY5_MYTED|nr:unnamed protein product [Mytilus edulis]